MAGIDLIQSYQLASVPDSRTVRVTRVIVIEASAKRVRQILGAPGVFLTQLGETKSDVTEIARTYEIVR